MGCRWVGDEQGLVLRPAQGLPSPQARLWASVSSGKGPCRAAAAQGGLARSLALGPPLVFAICCKSSQTSCLLTFCFLYFVRRFHPRPLSCLLSPRSDVRA